MDLVKVDSASWYPTGDILDRFTSKIWTERSQDDSDCELVTPDIEWALEAVPEGTYITHLETREVMEVQDIEISKNEDNKYEAIVTADGVETTLMRKRGIMGLRNDRWPLPQEYSNAIAGAAIVWDMLTSPYGTPLVSNIGGDRQDYTIFNAALSYSATGDYSASVGEKIVQPGPAYNQMRDYFNVDDIGFRSLRPNSFGVLLTFGEFDGGVFVPAGTTEDSLLFDIFDGVDRSEYLIFNYDIGDLQKAKYLRSIRNYANEAYMLSSTTSADDVFVQKDGAGPGTGIGTFRRQIIVDAEIDQTYQIGEDVYTMDLELYKTMLRHRGTVELTARRKRTYYRGAISPVSQYKFKTDYDLNDVVRVQGQYGLNDKFRVVEHIRTENAVDGDVGYPTLILAD